MVSIAFKRPLQTTQADFTGTLVAGKPVVISGSFYIPLSFDNFDAPDITVQGVNLVATATKITGGVGDFDNIRVGDIVGASVAGEIAAKTAITVASCYTVQGRPFVIYPHTVNLVSVGVRSGDAVSGGGIPANTVVDKIDYDNRTIYLNNNCTASGIQTAGDTLTFAPPVRVTAVRTRTALTNANEIDIDSTVSVAATNTNITIIPGALEAVAMVIKVDPVDNTTGSNINVVIASASVPGTSVVGSAAGYSGLDFGTLTYASLGTARLDGDTFLLDARVPRPVATPP